MSTIKDKINSCLNKVREFIIQGNGIYAIFILSELESLESKYADPIIEFRAEASHKKLFFLEQSKLADEFNKLIIKNNYEVPLIPKAVLNISKFEFEKHKKFIKIINNNNIFNNKLLLNHIEKLSIGWVELFLQFSPNLRLKMHDKNIIMNEDSWGIIAYLIANQANSLENTMLNLTNSYESVKYDYSIKFLKEGNEELKDKNIKSIEKLLVHIDKSKIKKFDDYNTTRLPLDIIDYFIICIKIDKFNITKSDLSIIFSAKDKLKTSSNFGKILEKIVFKILETTNLKNTNNYEYIYRIMTDDKKAVDNNCEIKWKKFINCLKFMMNAFFFEKKLDKCINDYLDLYILNKKQIMYIIEWIIRSKNITNEKFLWKIKQIILTSIIAVSEYEYTIGSKEYWFRYLKLEKDDKNLINKNILFGNNVYKKFFDQNFLKYSRNDLRLISKVDIINFLSMNELISLDEIIEIKNREKDIFIGYELINKNSINYVFYMIKNIEKDKYNRESNWDQLQNYIFLNEIIDNKTNNFTKIIKFNDFRWSNKNINEFKEYSIIKDKRVTEYIRLIEEYINIVERKNGNMRFVREKTYINIWNNKSNLVKELSKTIKLEKKYNFKRKAELYNDKIKNIFDKFNIIEYEDYF